MFYGKDKKENQGVSWSCVFPSLFCLNFNSNSVSPSKQRRYSWDTASFTIGKAKNLIQGPFGFDLVPS